MYNPSTELGKYFNDSYSKFNDYLLNLDKVPIDSHSALSGAIEDFFGKITDLPEKVMQLDYSLTVLFEIDQSIMGTYGSKLFSEEYNTPLTSLLRDVIALWYRYELLGKLERAHSSYYSVVGIRSFYENWLETEQVGINESEYDRVLKDVTMLLENQENLDISTRIQLFTMLGHIMVILGIDKEGAEQVFLKYSFDIKNRSVPSLYSLSEILLNIFVLYATKIDFKTLKNINVNDLQKAIRYLSATNNFAEILFKQWKVYWENDYFSELSAQEEKEVSQNPNSIQNLTLNPSVKMEIGHSYLEYLEYKKEHFGQAIIFNPIPIFLLGTPSSGKSSYLAAFCYDSQMNNNKSGFGSNTIVLGKELQAFYNNTLDAWKKNSISPTGSTNKYSFWEDLTIDSFEVSDYPGSSIEPGNWDKELLKSFFDAKALFFFIDDKDFNDVASLRQKAANFETNLQYWSENNPKVKNIPISIIVTKSDLLLGENMNTLERSYLISEKLKSQTIENYFPDRVNVNYETDTIYGRFCDSILNDKNNNKNPQIQDIVELILANFAPFFKRVFDITYNYQIFITSSKYPENSTDNLFPYGVKEPITWSTKILEKHFINETLVKYDEEQKQIETEIKELETDVINLHKVLHDLDDLEKKVLEAEERKGLIDILIRKEKLKELNRRKAEAEKKFDRILKDVNYEIKAMNKRSSVQELEKIIEDKKETISEMKNKRKIYESRK